MRYRGWTGSYYIYGDGYKQDMFGVEYVQRIGDWQRVETVEEFIASDKNGAEVYEGDPVYYEKVPQARGAANLYDKWLIEQGFIVKELGK